MSENEFVLILKFFLKIGVFVQEADVLVRGNCHEMKRVQSENKTYNYVDMISLGSNSAIAPMSAKISSLVVGRS